MKFKTPLFILAILLGACAQQPVSTTQSSSATTPAISPEQQQLVEQFKSTPCFTAQTRPQDPQIREIAIALSSGIQTTNETNPDKLPDYSLRVFSRYVDELDSQRHYFLANDIENAKIYESLLWATLKQGEVKPGYCIYAIYEQRIKEALGYAVTYLEGTLTEKDINGSEVLIRRDTQSPFFLTNADKERYWRNRALYDVLVKMANGANFSEAQQLAIKRYKSQLSRVETVRSQDIFESYANSFLAVLDENSQYYAPVSENIDIKKALNLEGIGLVLEQTDEGAAVVSLVPGGPSEGKLKPGDLIISVANNGIDFESVSGWRLDDIVEKIRGQKGSYVGLEIKPANQSATTTRLSIMRNTVKLKSKAVESEVVTVQREKSNHLIGVVHIPTFYSDIRAIQAGDPNARTVSKDLAQHIQMLKSKNIEGLVINLTNNGGGSLEEANNVASLFVAQRPTFVVKSKGQTEKLTGQNSASIFNGPIIALTNERSAGAAEIVAASIQDYGVGLIAGQRTYGMGSVASLKQLTSSSSASVKMSVAKYFHVTGEPFAGNGLNPDIELPVSLPSLNERREATKASYIPPVNNLSKIGDLSAIKNEIATRSKARQKSNPGFQYIRDRHQNLVAQLGEKTITLNLASVSQSKQQALQKEQAGYKAYIKAAGKPESSPIEDADKVENRIWVHEASELAVDWLEVAR